MLDDMLNYLSDDEARLPSFLECDPIRELKQNISTHICPNNIVPIIVECMVLLKHRSPSLGRSDSIEIICLVLHECPELNDLKPHHRAIVSKIYSLSNTRNLDIIRDDGEICCECYYCC